jgi:drug/metabolite transporter (DMT)-like permease
MSQDYWPVLQLAFGAMLALMALRFAFPQHRTPFAVAFLLVVAAAAATPEAPGWLRVGALLVAAAGATTLVIGRSPRRRNT